MINPNINGNRHQLIKMQPNDRLVEGAGGSGKVEKPTTPAVDTTQQVIDDFNNGAKSIDELKKALDTGKVPYQDNGSTITFEYKNKKYEITYKTETTTVSAFDKAMKDMDLRDTYYKGVYCEINKPYGQQKHYFWDAQKEVMVEIPGVHYVSKDGHEVKAFLNDYNNAATKGTNTTDPKKWEGDVDQKLKDLEAKYNSLLTTIKNNGGKVSTEMQKQLDEIKNLISQIKTEDSKNIDMGKLNLDLNSIYGYSTNHEKKIPGLTAGKNQARETLKGLKNDIYKQLLNQAKSLGIPENEFKTIFESQFNITIEWTVNNYVDVNDNLFKKWDNCKYKVKELVDGFIKKLGTNLSSKIETWKDSNPSQSVQDKFEKLENTIKGVDKEVTSDTNTKVTVDKNKLNLSSITGYSSKNTITATKDNAAAKAEIKTLLNKLKEQVYNQLLTQAKSAGIPENEFKIIFDKTYSSTIDWAISNKDLVTIKDKKGTKKDSVQYNVKDLVDGFITKLDANLDTELVKYKLKH